MTLSTKARKALATGLAISTFVMSFAMVLALPMASAAQSGDGCLVSYNGTVWLITNGSRRGFTSAEVFQSHGYNFGQVSGASAEDIALPVGPIMTYADGTLVKGPNDPLVYLVTNGQKRGFVSGSVFTGLGFSFANIQSAPVNTFSDLPTGANLESATERHGAGVLVNASGTIWKMTATGRMGIPSMAVFNSYGYMWSHIVAANSADLSTANEGVVSARAACSTGTTPVTGSVNVSLNGPASSTLIVGQATANLANFVFSGTGTVTSLTLKRTGVSADSTLEDVFLFDGDVRLTDSASVSNGNINFTNSSGLFTVNGSRTISVKADIAGSAGETVAVQLTSATLASGSVGGLPVSGNMHTLASATLATVAWSSPTDSGDVDPGNDILVWQGTATVGTRDVAMTRLALRNIGSINNADIKNFDLFVDGVLVSSQASLDSNGYVTFSFNRTLMSGARQIKVMADVIGGSSRTVEMSLRGSYDVVFTDSQYGANIESTGTFPFDSDGFTVNAGSISAVRATDSVSGNVVINSSDVSLGKWTLTAYGEPIKVETLNVGFSYTEATDDDNDATPTLRNGRLLINGSQYGSTATVETTGTSFTTNYTVNPGSPVTVEFRADTFDNDGEGAGFEDGDDVTAFLNNTGSGLKTVSGGSTGVIPTDDVNANSVNLTTGSIAVSTTSSYVNQTITTPKTAYKVGSYQITGSSTEDVNINTFSVDFTADPDNNDGADTLTAADLTNVYLVYGSNQTAPKGTVSATGNSYSVNYTLVKNTVVQVDVYASIGSDNAAGDDIRSELTVTGTAATSGTAVAPTEVNGQTLTIGSGSITATLDASTPAAQLVDDSGTVTTVAWKFAAVTDSYTITDLNFTIGDATAVSSVALMDGSTTLATRPGSTSVSFSGLNVPVSANSSKILTVVLTMSTVGVGAGTSDAALTTTMVDFTARNSAGTSAAGTESNPAGNAMYVHKAVPVLSAVALPSSDLSAGAGKVIAKFTVSSNGTGTVAWKQVMLEVSKTATPTLAGYALFNSDTGEQITAAIVVQNDTAVADADLDGSDTSGEILITVGTDGDDNVVEQVSGAKTYEVRATIGGAIATTDNISVTLDRNSATHSANADYLTRNNSGAANNASFVWSDESAAATSDTGESTWNNDYLVKNLPISWSLN